MLKADGGREGEGGRGEGDARGGARSWDSPYTQPPGVKHPYRPEEALEDIPGLQHALQLFLESRMMESEEYCRRMDERQERLYFATGFSLIQCVKGLMSYEDEDLLSALQHAKHGNAIASAHRKRHGILGSIGSIVSTAASVVSPLSGGGGQGGAGVGWVRSMTPVERHAELVYAESLFEKALLGIVYSGDWLAFIKEALNMRTTIGIYRQLYAFIEASDAEYRAAHPSSSPSSTDPAIDVHFRSGVLLGMGMSNIVLSLMPGKLMTLVELFGYHGDREAGLGMLMRAGGWDTGGEGEEPAVGAGTEGLRRSICDMSLLIFHLVISSFTFDGVSVPAAARILRWNLGRYPRGVFFLFGAGRLALMRSEPGRAVEYYVRAIEKKHEGGKYRNLDHISYWEIACASLALWDVRAGEVWWDRLEREASWSKAIYGYGLAVCLVEMGKEKMNGEVERRRRRARELMKKVPDLRQRIAGKSIPLEKFVARKARKFESQNHRLILPGLELAYIFQSISHAPRAVIRSRMLPYVHSTLASLRASTPKAWGAGYVDDVCLARFLEGVCLRYLAYPDENSAELEEGGKGGEDEGKGEGDEKEREDSAREAEAAFREVFQWGPKIELDHHLVYHAHYELGRLLACLGRLDEAHEQFELVLSGKYLEVGPSGRKGKYSLENALHVRTHAANEALAKRRHS
ncbi:hypothetical protein FA13DRAFT_1844951 [Coprinellus micaceus]|uniref:Tetratricopeptide repeat protein 39B n=1 Tax=Coprinellus micaceus TaxID=71717 RepID=A0A4Y7SDM2_COPMI|nr:hypothetical protein FA13DRAFT_1844951 [Coprinellus micaceus]